MDEQGSGNRGDWFDGLIDLLGDEKPEVRSSAASTLAHSDREPVEESPENRARLERLKAALRREDDDRVRASLEEAIFRFTVPEGEG